MSTKAIVASIKEHKVRKQKDIQKQKEDDQNERKKSQESEKENGKNFSHYKCSYYHRVLYRSGPYYVKGKESKEFNRRYYELPIESLKEVNEQTLGWTNRVLVQQTKKLINIYVPVSLSLKVKNIRELKFKDLEANVYCVLIISFNVTHLPKKIRQKLKTSIMVQINRGSSFLLRQETEQGKTNIKFKEESVPNKEESVPNKEESVPNNKFFTFFTFTIRQSFAVQIFEDIFLSPFEILRLVLSVTFNSVLINQGQQEKQGQKQDRSSFQYDPSKKYNVSFNCMRNPEMININYISGCRLGVYDLAENLLQAYPSNLASYDDIKQKFFIFVGGEVKSTKEEDDRRKNNLQSQLISNIQAPARPGNSLKPKELEKQEQGQKEKIKYYQYCHFVIPLYKYPGNALATIFIPVFMLALLSISIFFQGSKAVDQKIGSIATFVLGFIALIPSIKDELPPSQEITFSEIIVYTQALNCMLSLVSHWFTDSQNVWANPIFLLSLIIHIGCFSIALVMFYLHKVFWQPMYNRKVINKEINMTKHYKRYHNPYCDNLFLQLNKTKKIVWAQNCIKGENMKINLPVSNKESLPKDNHPKQSHAPSKNSVAE